MSLTRLERAQWMAGKGIGVFIVQPNSKRPLEGQSWYIRQSTEPKTIEQLFSTTPDCNYGLHLGSEYVVIDLDNKPGANGVVSFEKICADHDIWDIEQFETLTVKTPGGGYHLYFKAPFACANKNYFPDGIDVRGINGYVVGPGSVDTRGEWEIIDENADIQPLPEWLTEYIVEPGYKDPQYDIPLIELDQDDSIEHATLWLKERMPAIEGQNGDDWTYETIQYLRDFGLSEVKAHEVLNESGWNGRCEPPWGDAELEAKIENAYSYGQNRPGCKSPLYKAQQFVAARPEGGWAEYLSEEQLAEMFNPSNHLKLVVNNDEDDDIPQEVDDDEIDPVTGEKVEGEQIWFDVNEFMQQTQVRDYVVSEWLLAHGITHLIARRGTGKSTVALDLAFHVACDLDWHGIKTKEGWKVIYICGEDDVGLRLNCRAWVETNSGVAPDDGRFRVAKEIIKITDRRRLNLTIAELVKWADGVPCLVILDTWQRATSGHSRNDQQEMDTAVENAEFLVRHLNGCMLSCVHPPKDGRMTIVGSGVQEDTSAGIWTLEQEDDGLLLSIERIKGPGEDNYMKFEKKQIQFPEVDDFGKNLSGLTVKKIAGSEDRDVIKAATEEEALQMAWAEVVYGCMDFPTKKNVYNGETFDLSASKIAGFVERILHDAKGPKDDQRAQDARRFKDQYMPWLIEKFSGTMTKGSLEASIKKRFYEKKKAPKVKTHNGEIEVTLVQKSSKSTASTRNPHRVFKVSKVEKEEDKEKGGD